MKCFQKFQSPITDPAQRVVNWGRAEMPLMVEPPPAANPASSAKVGVRVSPSVSLRGKRRPVVPGKDEVVEKKVRSLSRRRPNPSKSAGSRLSPDYGMRERFRLD
jgi:hypothetical protein